MAPEPPRNWTKFGPTISANTSTTDWHVGIGWSASTGPQPTPRAALRQSSYARALAFEKSKRWETDLHKLRALLTSLDEWVRLGIVGQRRARLRHDDPPARAPRARTEWGMVHRARCVHRRGTRAARSPRKNPGKVA